MHHTLFLSFKILLSIIYINLCLRDDRKESLRLTSVSQVMNCYMDSC